MDDDAGEVSIKAKPRWAFKEGLAEGGLEMGGAGMTEWVARRGRRRRTWEHALADLINLGIITRRLVMDEGRRPQLDFTIRAA